MEKDKENRYQSAGEVSSDLTRIEKGIPTTERVVPKRKPITSKEITVTFGLKKLAIPALAVAALVVAAVIIWHPWSQKKAIIIPTDIPSLAIVYFENNSGDESLEYLRSGLSEWLITDLSQSKFINVLSGDRIYGILKVLNLLESKKYSTEDLIKVAEQGRVNHILKGSYIKIGDNFIITATLQKPQIGEVIRSIKIECKGEEEIPAKVDELTKQIKLNLNLSQEQIAADIDKLIGKITTNSPEAFRYYNEGLEHLWIGDYREAIPFFEKAVAIDPEFAMAYRSLAKSYGNMDYRTERKKFLQKAFELKNKLSDRERYLIEGDFYKESEETYDKAIKAYSKLLELYPDDWIGNTNMGALYLSLEKWDKAIERFGTNIQNRAKSLASFGNQATVYMAKGLYNKAKEVLEDYINNFSDNARIHIYLAANYLIQMKYDLALVEIDKASFLNPGHYRNLLMKGHIYLCKGDLTEAEEEYQKLIDTDEKVAHLRSRISLGNLYLLQGKFESSKSQIKQGIELAEKLGEMRWQGDCHFNLAYSYLKSGNPKETLEECNKAWSSYGEEDYLSGQRRALHYKGLAYLDMRSMNEAQRVADKLKELIERGMNKKHIRYYYYLMGVIELQRENFSKAIEYFKKALSLLPYQRWPGFVSYMHALFFDLLASAYYKAGDLENARKEYEKITLLTTGRLYHGDIYAKSFYMLGKIYEQKGWKGKAIEHYEKFLDLWKDADPSIPEVRTLIEDARKKLAEL